MPRPAAPHPLDLAAGGYAYLERPNATLLARLGYRLLRVEAARVVGDLAGVVAEISAALPEEGRRGG